MLIRLPRVVMLIRLPRPKEKLLEKVQGLFKGVRVSKVTQVMLIRLPWGVMLIRLLRLERLNLRQKMSH